MTVVLNNLRINKFPTKIQYNKYRRSGVPTQEARRILKVCDQSRVEAEYSKYLSKILVFDLRLNRITRGPFLEVYTRIIDEAASFVLNSEARSSYSPNLAVQVIVVGKKLILP